MKPQFQAANEVTPQEFLSILRRRKLVILQTFAVTVAIGIIFTFVTKPIYRSATRILVEGRSLTISQINANDPVSGLFLPSAGFDVGTQIEVLQSKNVLDDAYKQAGRAAKTSLKIKQVAETNVIEITADSTDPKSAEKLADALPKVYLRYITGNRRSEVTKALEFAQKRLKEESDKLRTAEMKLEAFRKRVRLVDLTTERSTKLQQAAATEGELRKATAEVKAARVRVQSYTQARNALSPFIETPQTVTNNLQIDAQKAKIAGLNADRARLLVLFKPNSAEVEKLDAQIAQEMETLAKIPATVTTTTRAPNAAVANYNDKIAEAQATLTAAEALLDDLKNRSSRDGNGLDKYSAIERQQAEMTRAVERHVQNVANLTKSVEDLSLRKQAEHDPMMVITPATTAEKVSPKLVNNIVMAVLLGLTLGVGFAMLQDYLDDRINSPDEARALTASPALGYVPLIKNQDIKLIGSGRSHSLLESYRVLRSNVQFSSVDGALQSLQLTSTNPGEGKSITALNLAIAMAMDGKQIILVDADLRLPTVHEKLGVPQQPGLTNVLLGRLPLEDALRETDVPGLRILTAGLLPPNPAELLNSAAMRRLHEELKDHADMVIFDGPPCLATADAQVIASFVDGTLYVIHLGETKKTAIRHSMELLRQAHAKTLGVIFNKIDLNERSHNYYYYYSYNNYNYRYGKSALNGGNGRHSADDEDALALVRRNGKHGDKPEALPSAADGHEESRT
jgi:polysaccharide biosynthesis transport protein